MLVFKKNLNLNCLFLKIDPISFDVYYQGR